MSFPGIAGRIEESHADRLASRLHLIWLSCGPAASFKIGDAFTLHNGTELPRPKREGSAHRNERADITGVNISASDRTLAHLDDTTDIGAGMRLQRAAVIPYGQRIGRQPRRNVFNPHHHRNLFAIYKRHGLSLEQKLEK